MAIINIASSTIAILSTLSILTLSKIKCQLEDLMKVNIDIIHGPIREDDMIEIGKVVELYAA